MLCPLRFCVPHTFFKNQRPGRQKHPSSLYLPSCFTWIYYRWIDASRKICLCNSKIISLVLKLMTSWRNTLSPQLWLAPMLLLVVIKRCICVLFPAWTRGFKHFSSPVKVCLLPGYWYHCMLTFSLSCLLFFLLLLMKPRDHTASLPLLTNGTQYNFFKDWC